MTDSSSTDTVFVFVHGAWHSSGQWAATQRALAGLGAASMAVDLPGHGFDAPLPTGYLQPGQPGLLTEKSALATVTMDDSAEAVLDTLRRARHHRRVVLVAHSAGGGPASLAAERAPELVDEIVYLSAFVPAGRPRFFDYLGSPENATARGQSLNLGDPGGTGRRADQPALAGSRLRRGTAADPLPRHCPGPLRPLALGAEPRSAAGDPHHPGHRDPQRWGRVPRTFLRCADDRALPTAVQDLMIAEADRAMPGNPFTVRTLPGSHSPFAARPRELAAALLP